jgi:hypothetical protein
MEDDKSFTDEKSYDKPYGDVESSSVSSETARFLENDHIHIKRRRRFNYLQILRIAFEVGMVAVLAGLFISGSVKFKHHHDSSPIYGPIFPRKNVILGNAAHLGPDVEYNNQKMLWNKTEMNHIHRNWQQLFPSECLTPQSASSLTITEGRGYVMVDQFGEDFTVLHPPFG